MPKAIHYVRVLLVELMFITRDKFLMMIIPDNVAMLQDHSKKEKSNASNYA
jgi:hypothetical protein